MSSIFREKLKLTKFLSQYKKNKVNLRDLIAATGLVILLELDLNHWFSAHATLKFDEWTKRKVGHLFYTTSSFVHHFKSDGEFKLELQSEDIQFGPKSVIYFCLVWHWNFMDDLTKRWGTSSALCQALCIISKPWVN